MSQLTLTTLPPELLHPIALFAAQSNPDATKGPPTSLPALLLTCRTIYNTLSISSNPALYAEIFKQQFDFDADRVRRRCGGGGDADTVEVSPHMLAVELKTRFESLKRLRRGVGCHEGTGHDEYRERDLWTAVFMMMENEGKNICQLRDYALITKWLIGFFLSSDSASGAVSDLLAGTWPKGGCGDEKSVNALALWLFWLYITLQDHSPVYEYDLPALISTYAIAGNKYPVAPHWSSFCLPNLPDIAAPASISYYNSQLNPRPPPIALPAILAFVSQRAGELVHPIVRDSKTAPHPAEIWDLDWDRWIRGQPEADEEGNIMKYYYPSMLDGTWEGLFTYTDFETYSDLLSDGFSHILQGATVRHNLQVWRLREYFLPSEAHATESNPPDMLPVGSALDGFLPTPTIILSENDSQIVFGLNGRSTRYVRAIGAEVNQNARDVVLFGEGHSSWGDFVLRGRIRREDAFVSIIKQYVSLGVGGRPKWLYRGYIVGGRLVGRWRDSITRIGLDGYEGAFEMRRRGVKGREWD
ncbi:hypothetical protein BU17DRAFT_46039 [Hysterangium stoloniferum]|nr:hypothetical protein BU17DRAFT_46039 [Hysterangium stoloniferum]